MIRRLIFSTSIAICWSAAFAVGHAQAPQASATAASPTRLMRFAGALTNAAGEPLVGQQIVTFTLFDQPQGGTPLWTDTLTVTADDRGRFAVNLGASTALPQHVFNAEQARWIGTTIDGRDLGRTALVAVPYALKAADADTLGGHAAATYVRTRQDGKLETGAGLLSGPSVGGAGVAGQLAKWTDSANIGSSVVSESSDNRVGFGLTDPTAGHVIDSVFTIKNFDNNTGFGILNESLQRRFAINTLFSGGYALYDGGSGVWNQGLVQVNGFVGLGTATPLDKLHVVSTGATGAVLGVAASGRGVEGQSSSGVGVIGFSATGIGALVGQSQGSAPAGQFNGNVNVSGTLTKGGGSFKIDHPLDPTNKYLEHSFVESPDMMNVYNGNATLDASGEATVTLPDWFEALNRDFRYQLTSVGSQANPYIAMEVTNHAFKIAGGAPNGKVSWQVTGIRQDPWANANRIAVEEQKPESERGTYLHPEAYGQPESMGLAAKALRDIMAKPATENTPKPATPNPQR
jgi:hypothetical protein